VRDKLSKRTTDVFARQARAPRRRGAPHLVRAAADLYRMRCSALWLRPHKRGRVLESRTEVAGGCVTERTRALQM